MRTAKEISKEFEQVTLVRGSMTTLGSIARDTGADSDWFDEITEMYVRLDQRTDELKREFCELSIE